MVSKAVNVSKEAALPNVLPTRIVSARSGNSFSVPRSFSRMSLSSSTTLLPSSFKRDTSVSRSPSMIRIFRTRQSNGGFLTELSREVWSRSRPDKLAACITTPSLTQLRRRTHGNEQDHRSEDRFWDGALLDPVPEQIYLLFRDRSRMN